MGWLRLVLDEQRFLLSPMHPTPVDLSALPRLQGRKYHSIALHAPLVQMYHPLSEQMAAAWQLIDLPTTPQANLARDSRHPETLTTRNRNRLGHSDPWSSA